MRLGSCIFFPFYSMELVLVCRFAFDMFVFFLHRISFSTALFLYYYHLNINVVGYNSVGFIILCTERTAHTGHLYHSLIHYAYVCWCLCMLNHFAIDLHWKWLRLFRMCMLVHSNYSSDKNTGNISEKNIADKKSVCVFFSFIPLVFVRECQSFFPLCPFNPRYLVLCISNAVIPIISVSAFILVMYLCSKREKEKERERMSIGRNGQTIE